MADTILTSEPVCPACGHKHDTAWDWNFDSGLEDEAEHSCDNCGERFFAVRVVTVAYITCLLIPPTDAARTVSTAREGGEHD